jgi:hypothetical protein
LNILTHKLKEVLFAVLPITVVVLILGFTLAPLETPYILRFLVGAVSVILGLSIFLFGVDIGITPMGNEIGAALIKPNKLWIITCAGFFLAFIISVAEPDLHILAAQVSSVTSGMISKTSIVVIVSLGVGAMLSVGLIRIVKNIPLYIVLTIFYGIILILSLFTTNEFIAISFDASGATTGALTVPFILAIAIGVSKLKKDSKASEKDSFGLVAIASIGAIIAVMVMSIISGSDRITASLEMESSTSQSIFGQYFSKLPGIALESFFALLPLFAILMLFQKKLKLSKRTLRRMILGFLYTLIGLTLFLTGVNAGFMDAGRIIGYKLATLENKFIIIATGFVLGFTTILAEPAVYVLTKSIENVTSGYIKRRAVLIALSIGIGIAVALSTVRILVPELQLWHYLLPGYIISIAMSYIAPKLFVGIAFDSGGVASGPMTATFILAFTQGAAEAIETADVLIDGFGMIAAVALMPLIALQTLGIIYKIKSKKGGLEVGKLPD